MPLIRPEKCVWRVFCLSHHTEHLSDFNQHLTPLCVWRSTVDDGHNSRSLSHVCCACVGIVFFFCCPRCLSSSSSEMRVDAICRGGSRNTLTLTLNRLRARCEHGLNYGHGSRCQGQSQGVQSERWLRCHGSASNCPEDRIYCQSSFAPAANEWHCCLMELFYFL